MHNLQDFQSMRRGFSDYLEAEFGLGDLIRHKHLKGFVAYRNPVQHDRGVKPRVHIDDIHFGVFH